MTTERTDIEESVKTKHEENITISEAHVSSQEPLVDVKQTESFLLSEIERNKELTKKTWKWGSVAVVVLALYLTAILSSVRSVVFDSEGIAAIVSNEIDRKLPEQLSAVENTLIADAPENASNLILAILSTLPNVRKQGQQVIDEVYTSIPLLGEEVTSTIKAYMAENGDELRDFAQTHSEQEFATYFMDELTANIMLDLDLHLKQNGEKKGLGAVKELSLSRLVALNTYLEKLANTGRFDLSERELLERRTLVTWLKILDWE